MTTLSYTEQTVQASPLLDEEQWQALLAELSLELLHECAQELLQEVYQQWVEGRDAALLLDPAAFVSMAHKSAGASGTMAFARLRQVFVCVEQGGQQAQTQGHLDCVGKVLQDTQAELAVRLQSNA